MTDRKAEIIVGITVTAAILILILGIIWGKGLKLFSPRSTYTVRFENIGGLEKGDPIVVRGMEQGQVDRVRLKDDFVEVRFWLDQSVRLQSNFTVLIESREIIGGKQISIEIGNSGKPADPKKIYDGRIQGDILMVLSQADCIFTKMDSIMTGLSLLIEDTRINQILANMEMSTHEAKAMFHELRPKVHSTVSNLNAISQTLTADSSAQRLNRVLTRLDSAAASIHMAADLLQAEEGTMGKLMKDRVLFDQMLQASVHLDSLIQDIKINPKRYMHVSLF